ncbi:Arf GTPase activating protein [Dillenia turbinata]|uniref:Arf GTPase activating protein n=1 Tax=Dillenia turbinata TaxID=194707 RepID=A0AAN8VD47_9MAGN
MPQDIKVAASKMDSRRRFDKAVHTYDQALEKFSSLKKSTREDIVAELEEVHALANIEAKKKYEFLESFSAIMDAHLRYFKLGYNLLSELEPFIHQVLTYAQQSKEVANVEQDKLARRIQEFRTQAELDNLRVSVNAEAQEIAANNAIGSGSNNQTRVSIETIFEFKRRLEKEGSQFQQSTGSSEHSGVLSRFRSKYNRSSSLMEEKIVCSTIDLRTATVKIDAEDADLRLCFRIISPTKSYTLQAETEADRAEWINKIKGVIASLLSSNFLPLPYAVKDGTENKSSPNEGQTESLEDGIRNGRADYVSKTLREIPGNNLCAECNAPAPDWASLNIGILLCIECSGVHRNLGVHVSKVRSITLDVKVWEPTVLELFSSLGNTYCNSVWEELLQNERVEDSNESPTSIMKPCPKDNIYKKEKFIQAKYVEKLLVKKASGFQSKATSIWEAVNNNNLREVYRLVAMSDSNIINTIYDEVFVHNVLLSVNAQESETGYGEVDGRKPDCAHCQGLQDSNEPKTCLQGCSLLHLACHRGNLVMLELLLQLGADINMRDFHGRTPLHHCIFERSNKLAKHLLKRGASPSIKDGSGLSSLERAMEMGAITDEELFIMLSDCRQNLSLFDIALSSSSPFHLSTTVVCLHKQPSIHHSVIALGGLIISASIQLCLLQSSNSNSCHRLSVDFIFMCSAQSTTSQLPSLSSRNIIIFIECEKPIDIFFIHSVSIFDLII